MSNNKQQTAVDWYAKEHKKFREEPWKYVNSGGEEAILKQAKEMEKERMIEFGELCWKNLLRSDVIMRPRDVYNETYGGNNEQ
jgi:hypothetical protein